jgi:hypothetical protein
MIRKSRTKNTIDSMKTARAKINKARQITLAFRFELPQSR